MNLKLTIILLSVLLLALSIAGVRAQVVVVGHVTAEVVESVSASAKIHSDFELKPSSGSVFENPDTQLSDLDLGTMTVRTGQNVTCNVVIQPARVNSATGKAFTVDPEFTTKMNSTRDARTLRIKGKTKTSGDLSGGVYKGSYTMVFAYN
jgi:hypothetical protein